MDKLAQSLRNVRDAAQRAQRMAEKSQETRDLARQMAEKLTPEQQEQVRKMAQEWTKQRKPGSGPGDQPVAFKPQKPSAPRDAGTQPVEARPKQPPSQPTERVLAEYYSDRPYDRKPGEAAAAPMSDEFQKAADAVERGSELQPIPARYQEMVKRVFKRYAEQTAPPPEPKK